VATRPPAPIDERALAATQRPFAVASMLPRAAYGDPDVLSWERQHLFDGGWVCAGRLDAVARPGSQLAIRIGLTSVLIVRGGDGVLRAFANICRHRGHELLPCGAAAERSVVQCPYHAWSYELDGSLRLAPHAGDVADVRRDELSLLPVAAAKWGGWAFVNVDGRAGPFADHLGALADLLAPWGTECLAVGATHHYDLAANWKVAIENYHECYHCPLIHPELCRVSPADSGENIADLPGAFIGGPMVLADGAATMSLDGRSPVAPLPGLTAIERRQVMYVNVFPNLLISLHPDYVMTHRIEPVTATTSRIECQWLFDPDAVADPGFDPSWAVDFWDVTNRQDWAAVESVQRGLDSPRFVPGVFGEREDGVHHFASMVAGAYAGMPLSRAMARPTTT